MHGVYIKPLVITSLGGRQTHTINTHTDFADNSNFKKRNWNSRKMGTGAGTEHGNGYLQNCCYSSDSSPVRFTEL